MAVIEVHGLTKAFRTYKKAPGFLAAIKGMVRRKYETTLAVKEVSFAVEEGELVGFLGPNGAGKTTTLKMLAGLLYPTSGSARVLSYVPWERADGYRRQFALLLGQKNQLWWDLPARESLELNGKIYGIPTPVFELTLNELSELLQVKDKLGVMVRELSLGERTKCELITACSWAAPAPMRSPTTTSPVAITTRTCRGEPAAVASFGTASTRASPARMARSASCSCARG